MKNARAYCFSSDIRAKKSSMSHAFTGKTASPSLDSLEEGRALKVAEMRVKKSVFNGLNSRALPKRRPYLNSDFE